MGKVKRKISVLRALQVAFYALGFPLFVHLVVLASKTVRENPLSEVSQMATIIALVMWAVVILAQLIMRALCRKNRMARAVVCSLIAAVITIAPIVYSDFVLKESFNEAKAEAEEAGVTGIEHYEHQITDYQKYASNFTAEVNEFMGIFNLTEFNGKDFNASGKNTDGSEVIYSEEDKAYYSPNGMYSDGYLFSYKQAVKVLTDYYENKYAYEDAGKDIDVELAKAIAELESNKNSDWSKYKRGASESSFAMEDFEYISSSDEYELAYGDEGTANKYFITEERLDAILSVIGEKLGENESVSGIISLLPTLGYTLPEGLDIKSLLNKDLDAETILDVINGLGLGKTLNGLVGVEGDEFTSESLFGLLADYSSYQSPTTYPVYYFIEDEALRDYAYARYYAKIHGGNVGSVLVGTVDKNGVETVGCIGLSGVSNANPYTGREMLNMFKKWEFQETLINDYYPMFAVRSIALKMSAAIVFTLLASYFFAEKVDEQYAKLTLKREGGNR